MISSGARFLPSTVVDMRLLYPHNMLQHVRCKQTYRAAYSTAASAVYVKLAFLKAWVQPSQTTLRGTHSSVYTCCFVWWVFVRWHCSKASFYARWDHFVSDGRAARKSDGALFDLAKKQIRRRAKEWEGKWAWKRSAWADGGDRAQTDGQLIEWMAVNYCQPNATR